jgi:hypothetical protein
MWFSPLDARSGWMRWSKGSAAGGSLSHRTSAISSKVQALFDQMRERFGGLDLLFKNAGVGINGRFVDTKPEDWKTQIDANLYGVLNCTHAAIPLLKGGKGAMICVERQWPLRDRGLVSLQRDEVCGRRFSRRAPKGAWTRGHSGRADRAGRSMDRVGPQYAGGSDAPSAREHRGAHCRGCSECGSLFLRAAPTGAGQEILIRPVKQVAP